MLSYAEENYLKAIYHLSDGGVSPVSTNNIAEFMDNKPASVTDMLKKLSAKDLLLYQKYRGVNISNEGKKIALQIIRKHRLWEVFLVEKLKFNWDQIHEVAEELEHIKSPLLIQRLDAFLDHPKTDPHGEPIPDENGNIPEAPQVPMDTIDVGYKGKIVGVVEDKKEFLMHLDKLGIYLGAKFKVIEKVAFDSSLEILLDGDKPIFLSNQVSKNLLVIE